MSKPGDPSPRRMLFQFSAYGFLKNQRYHEPFWILFFLQLGLSFFTIGLLRGYAALLVNLLEVPSGAIADLYGRRRSMIFSFLAYVCSFVLFAFSTELLHLFVAMTFFGLGDAFRTGTHKAMIFAYLSRTGRTSEKTRYYGTTRSWSKLGSAVSVVIASVMVFFSVTMEGVDALRAYRLAFLACVLPYLLGLLNFLLYPSFLDGAATGRQPARLRQLLTHLLQVGREALRPGALRRLLVESMGFEGLYKVAEDYLQPLVRATAMMAVVLLPTLAALQESQRTAVAIGGVYFVLYLLSSYSSRRSDAVLRWRRSEERGAGFLWLLQLATFSAIGGGLLLNLLLGDAFRFVGLAVAITGFLALAVLQNLWRPLHIGRFDTISREHQGATVLSFESQAKSLSAAVLAPLLGLAVDGMAHLVAGLDELTAPPRFLPVAAAGALAAATILLLRRRPHPGSDINP